MKLTQEDINFFKALSQTQTGAYLKAYITRVQDYAHDSRSWKDGMTKEAAAHTSALLSDLILDKIQPPHEASKVRSQYES